jgi:hypothetical protein
MPSSRSRRARRLVAHIETTTAERHQSWSEGDQPNVTERAATELERLHGAKRAMRRDLYAAVPHLEGQPVHRGRPERMSTNRLPSGYARYPHNDVEAPGKGLDGKARNADAHHAP